jgi:hypothetical protein
MHGLLRYDPGDGKLAHIPLALAPSTAVGEIGTSSGVAYLGVSGLTGSANAVVAYSPATGALVRYPFMFITRIVPTPGGFAWVFPQGGNVSEVFALSLRRPVPDGAGCVGFNGVWSVNFDAEADMFCEESGVPMTCASGETGRVLASLTVPGATKYDDGTPGTSPPVIAVGDGLLLLAAGRSGSSPVYGVAIYQLDPRCQ